MSCTFCNSSRCGEGKMMSSDQRSVAGIFSRRHQTVAAHQAAIVRKQTRVDAQISALDARIRAASERTPEEQIRRLDEAGHRAISERAVLAARILLRDNPPPEPVAVAVIEDEKPRQPRKRRRRRRNRKQEG